MTALRTLLATLAALITLAIPAMAQTPLVVDVTQGHLDPTPVAIPDFLVETSREAEIGADISRVIANNLETSGLFAPVSEDAFIEEITDIDLRPRFGDCLLPGQAARHEQHRRDRARLAGRRQHRAQHHDHPFELPAGPVRGDL